jgi:hypothetical protein
MPLTCVHGADQGLSFVLNGCNPLVSVLSDVLQRGAGAP